MKKYSLALFALATTLAVAPPSALCDSFGYRTSDSMFGAVLGGAPNGIAETGIFTSMELAGTSGPTIDTGHRKVERPISGAFFFDDLLQGNKSANRDNTDALLDLNELQLALLSGIDDGGQKSGKSGKFFFADKGTYRVSNELQRGGGLVGISTMALTETPEPGSLFLLGTGLLGLALALFWKAAKRSIGT